MSYNDIEWNDVIKKEARGVNDEEFGKVREVRGNYIIIQNGLIDKEKYFIPKDQAESYDKVVLKFRISESDLKTRYKDEPFMCNAESDTIENDMNKLEETLDSQEYTGCTG